LNGFIKITKVHTIRNEDLGVKCFEAPFLGHTLEYEGNMQWNIETLIIFMPDSSGEKSSHFIFKRRYLLPFTGPKEAVINGNIYFSELRKGHRGRDYE
jgi:hypothetical protein